MVTSKDNAITLTVPPNAAADGTVVRIRQSATPAGITGLATINDLDITPLKGALRRGRVTVHYDPAAVERAGGSAATLVMLLQDDDKKWQALPIRVDAANQTVSADWPHFSRGVLGAFKSGKWWVDNVLTFNLGPEKKPDCDNDDLRIDPGWSFRTTNDQGGKMHVAPLDGCVALASASEIHRGKIANRYWYAFRAPLPQGVTTEFGDLLAYNEIQDLLIGLPYRFFGNAILIPGQGEAQFSVRQEQEGQFVRFHATAEPVSIVLAAVTTAIDAASLGTAAGARVATHAAIEALWDERKAGKIAIHEINELMAKKAWRERVIAEHAPGQPTEILRRADRVLQLILAVNCAYQAVNDGLTAFSADQLAESMKKVATTCAKLLVSAAMGAVYDSADPDKRVLMAAGFVKGLLDVKPYMATNEASLASWAQKVGLDYWHATLTATQARDPRKGPLSPLPADAFFGGAGIDPVHEVGRIESVSTYPDGTAEITVDRVTWHWCHKDPEPWPAECTNDHWVKNDNTLLRRYTVKSTALLRFLPPTGEHVWSKGKLKDLQKHIEQREALWDIRHNADSTVSGLGEIWTP
ncbi:hypothetical protein BWI15_12280 [Kribbella sp. ALI-6-A]|nr:hypothetical protein BWI15_12280 [Kribbella sp. ALI-6-A]